MRLLNFVLHGISNQRIGLGSFGGVSRLRSFTATLLLACLAGITSVPTSYGQITISRTPLIVSPQGTLSTFWNVQEAGLREDFTGTAGYLRIQNTSTKSLDGVIFYTEYFDSVGRFCFSLVLSRETPPGKDGPIAPGDVGYFGSLTTGLFASVEPKEVKTFLVQQRIAGQLDPAQNWNIPIRAPVTVSGYVASKLQLGSEIRSGKTPFLDLILAKVTVNKSGSVADVEILDAESNEVKDWFLNFIQQQVPFYPATEAGALKTAQTLVMVRAVISLSEVEIQNSSFLPRMSPWVKSYLQTVKDADMLPVMNIVFSRPPTKLERSGKLIEMPATPEGSFEVNLLFGDWSSSAFNPVRDTSMPRHMRRQLIVPPSR